MLLLQRVPVNFLVMSQGTDAEFKKVSSKCEFNMENWPKITKNYKKGVRGVAFPKNVARVPLIQVIRTRV